MSIFIKINNVLIINVFINVLKKEERKTSKNEQTSLPHQLMSIKKNASRNSTIAYKLAVTW